MSEHEPDGVSRCSPAVPSQSEFDRVIARTVSWASQCDGALPVDVFFGVWADFRRMAF
jgi:hypothetical protein